MVCVYCGSATQVVNSRSQIRSNNIWRRRKCSMCLSIFTSIESADLSTVLRVAQDAHTMEPFIRERLFISIYESCKHRPSAIPDATSITKQIISCLIAAQSATHPGLITKKDIIMASLKVLGTFDIAAATAYGAYHPQ